MARDVARAAAIAQELSVGRQERPAADAEMPENAIRPRALEREILERASRGRIGVMGLPLLFADAEADDLAAGLADMRVGGEAGLGVDLAGQIGEAELRVLLPEPIGGGFGKIAEPLLAALDQGLRRLALGELAVMQQRYI